MNKTMKYMVCDECGKTVEQQLTPIQYGCNPYIGWIRVEQIADVCFDNSSKSIRGDFCCLVCLVDYATELETNSTNR